MAPLIPAVRTTPAAEDGGRNWFHLPDVLPLALHAVSTPDLAPTAAPLTAFAPLVPALTWRSGSDGDTLASNGMPAGTTSTAVRTSLDPTSGTAGPLEVLATTSHVVRRVDVIGPDADGLYPVGAHLWTWLPLDGH
jgi:hypothetical protein